MEELSEYESSADFNLRTGTDPEMDLSDRIILMGVDAAAVFRGEYARSEIGLASACYDPYASNGFLLSAKAETIDGSEVFIGFGMEGEILRATIDGRLVRGDDAMTAWVIAAHTPAQ